MNILVVGSGGREHAIAWRCAQEGHRVFVAPGNPGIVETATCLPLQSRTPAAYVQAARQCDAALTIVGPETPLVEGIVDHFTASGLRIFGPSAAAARMEGSKAFAKEFMARHNIPTARFQVFDDIAAAIAALARFEYPVVIKADGLAAGKGVVIAKDRRTAEHTLHAMFAGQLVGEAGARVVIEDFWRGEEVSYIAICDGLDAMALPPSQDHKAAYDNDEGPNTGGMGAYCDDRILSPAENEFILRTVIQPTLRGLADEGMPFLGFLYAGLMMSPQGPRVLEFNVRLGDPETQALLYRINGGFVDTLFAATEHRLSQARLQVPSGASACVVLAANGYPQKVRTGDAIFGLDAIPASEAKVFCAGVCAGAEHLETSGGRVLAITARGEGLPQALERVYRQLPNVRFEGMHFRRDIGKKGLKRYTG